MKSSSKIMKSTESVIEQFVVMTMQKKVNFIKSKKIIIMKNLTSRKINEKLVYRTFKRFFNFTLRNNAGIFQAVGVLSQIQMKDALLVTTVQTRRRQKAGRESIWPTGHGRILNLLPLFRRPRETSFITTKIFEIDLRISTSFLLVIFSSD